MELAQILESISVIVACISVVLGVDAWKREHIGKRKIELAEDILTYFYEARDAIRRIRNPFGMGGEGQSRKPSGYETPEEKELLDRAYVVFERYEKESEVFNKLHATRYRVMARFGIEAKKPFDDIRVIVNDIFRSARKLGTYYWKRQGRVQMSEPEFQKHLKEMHEQEAIFWEGGEEDDPINKRLDRIIEDAERIFRPAIEEQARLGSLLITPLRTLLRRK